MGAPLNAFMGGYPEMAENAEIAKLRADNKALLDAAKGVKKLLEEPSPFYLKKLGGPITEGDQKQIDDVFIALDAAIEHSEPQ